VAAEMARRRRGRATPMAAVQRQGKHEQPFAPPAWRPLLKGVAAFVTIKHLARQA